MQHANDTPDAVNSSGQHPDLLTVDEAAAYCRLTAYGLYSQRHRGERPGALGFKLGRRVVWRRADLDAYFEEMASAARQVISDVADSFDTATR